MQSRARFAWREKAGRTAGCPAPRWLPVGGTPRAPGRTSPHHPAGCPQPTARWRPAPFQGLAPQTPKPLLEGFCAEPHQEDQIAVNSNGLMLFLRVADIEWAEMAEPGVELHVGPQTYGLRDSLAALAAKLPPDRFLRLSPSLLVNRSQIRALQPMPDGEYQVLLRNGKRLNRRAASVTPRVPSLNEQGIARVRGRNKEGGLPAPFLASQDAFNQRLKWKP